jgi:hypothetical protein
MTTDPGRPPFVPIRDDEALDGNAAGGALAAVLGVDLTASEGTCSHCGTTSVVATLRVYPSGPGIVLRCPACSSVVAVVIQRPDGARVDVRGLTGLGGITP